MSVSTHITIHGELEDLSVRAFEHSSVVELRVGTSAGLFLGDDTGRSTKATTLACLRRWLQLVDALDDPVDLDDTVVGNFGDDLGEDGDQ